MPKLYISRDMYPAGEVSMPCDTPQELRENLAFGIAHGDRMIRVYAVDEVAHVEHISIFYPREGYRVMRDFHWPRPKDSML